MTFEDREKIIKEVLDRAAELRGAGNKGGEYNRPGDCFAYFKEEETRAGDSTRFQICRTLWSKQNAAIYSAIKKNPEAPLDGSEPFLDRVADAINYLLFMEGMRREIIAPESKCCRLINDKPCQYPVIGQRGMQLFCRKHLTEVDEAIAREKQTYTEVNLSEDPLNGNTRFPTKEEFEYMCPNCGTRFKTSDPREACISCGMVLAPGCCFKTNGLIACEELATCTRGTSRYCKKHFQEVELHSKETSDIITKMNHKYYCDKTVGKDMCTCGGIQ